MRLLYFNPETEYALATGASFYTPPAIVESYRKSNQLLPEAWASPDDIILVDDATSLDSKCKLTDWSMLSNLLKQFPDLVVDPWGWNHALIHRLKEYGVPARHLPDDITMNNIRMLAHRRTTIILNKEWNKLNSNRKIVEVPEELNAENHCMEFLEKNPGCWMKAPWSSSGRGVINTAADMTREQVLQWCHGIIRRQGSILAETGARRVADFATEWHIERGVATYLGLSCFNTSNRGKYINNRISPQNELNFHFNSLCEFSIDEVVYIQKQIIEKHLTSYSGLLGVDMIIESNGRLRPFVEINLRRTMGMLYLNL